MGFEKQAQVTTKIEISNHFLTNILPVIQLG